MDTQGNVFNIAVGERISLNDLIAQLQKLIGTNVIPRHIKERDGDVRDSLADISKAQKILDYCPEVKIKDGLERTVEWYKKQIVAEKC